MVTIYNSQDMEAPKCLSTDEWIKKMWYIYIYRQIDRQIDTMEYYSAIKKNEIMPFAKTWIDLQIVILNEISQKEKDKYHDITYMWNLKYDTNELIYEIDSQIYREQTCGCQGEGWGLGVWDQQMQTIIYRMDKQGLIVQHRELYSISRNKPQWKRIKINK